MKQFGRLALGLAALWWLAAPAVASDGLAEKVQQHQLANGLTLLVVERHDSPTFAAYLTIGVGSVHETSCQRGVAHLLEHMLFKGTTTIGTRDWQAERPLLAEIERVGSEIDRLRAQLGTPPLRLEELQQELERLQQQHRQFVVKDEFSQIYAAHGGTGFNAFTSRDLTTYLVSLPANKLELWAALESDRMRQPVLREFYTEREVVREERRRAYDSDADGMLYEALLTTAYTVHPYRNPIIGWDSDIRNLSLAETRSFLQAYYAPVNTVIALVGDVQFAEAVAMVERYFGGIPPGVPVPRVTDEESPQRGEKRRQVNFAAEPQLLLAFHKPTLPHRDDYVFDLIELLLAGGRTSRLYRSLVLERQLATSVAAFSTPGARYPNLFVFKAIPRYPYTVAEVEAAILEELERFKQAEIAPAELEQARNRLATDRLRGLRDNGQLARMLSWYQSVTGDWRYLLDYDAVVAGINADEVRAVAQRYLNADNRTVVILSKKEGE